MFMMITFSFKCRYLYLATCQEKNGKIMIYIYNSYLGQKYLYIIFSSVSVWVAHFSQIFRLQYITLSLHHYNAFGGLQQRARGTTTTKTTITTIIQICDSMAYLEQSPLVQVLLDLGRLEPHDDGHDGGRCDQRGVCKVQQYAIEVGHGCGRRLSGQRLDSRDGGVPERHSRDKSVHRGRGQDSLAEDSCGSK